MGLFDIFRVGKIKAENEALKQKLQDLHADEYWQVKEHLDRMNSEIADNNITLSKQHEKEESKFKTEIDKLTVALSESTSASDKEQLHTRILDLQKQLSDIIIKKDEIVNLQNGKAGNVYIISNLGSFGQDVFKIGMTRRLDPQDRVNELGSASVPFKFDVHSFIFSEDAVGLEKKLHETLNEKRLNKVNMRKEFFKIDITELEKLVSSIDPTAEFNSTMLAEEYRQSVDMQVPYEPIYSIEEFEEDEE